MRGPSLRRWSGSLPWGFLTMVALVGAIEVHGARNSLIVASPYFGGGSWRYAGSRVKARAPGRDILCMGDSQVNLGIIPAVIRERTGKTAFNLAVYSGAPPATYFLLRRALAAGARPSAIVFDLEKNIQTDGPTSKRRPYPWAELLSLREAAELAWEAGDASFFTDLLVRKASHTVKVRLELRRHILAALKGEQVGDRDQTIALWRNFNQNDGGSLFERNPNFRDNDPPPPPATPLPGTWLCDRVNAIYLKKFLKLAARVHARVYLLLPPHSPGQQANFEYSGDEARYLRFVRGLRDRYAHLVIIDGRYSGYPPEIFHDGWHLTRDGATALSADVAQILMDARGTKVSASRWIALPRYTPRSTHAPTETLEQSRAIVQKLLSDQVRVR